MRVMVIVKADKNSEAGILPDKAIFEKMGKYNEELVKAGVMLAVGHVMRYTPYTRAVKEIVESGQLGDIMSVQHLEPVGFWHQAHSYVRGHWRRRPALPRYLAPTLYWTRPRSIPMPAAPNPRSPSIRARCAARRRCSGWVGEAAARWPCSIRRLPRSSR